MFVKILREQTTFYKIYFVRRVIYKEYNQYNHYCSDYLNSKQKTDNLNKFKCHPQSTGEIASLILFAGSKIQVSNSRKGKIKIFPSK